MVFSCALASSLRAAILWEAVGSGLARSWAVSAITCVAVCSAASKPSYLRHHGLAGRCRSHACTDTAQVVPKHALLEGA